MNKILTNKKGGKLEGWCAMPRCWWSKKESTISSLKGPRTFINNKVLIKCGDCDKKVVIYYSNKEENWLELNGVLASKQWWKELFKEVGLI